jgi:hypothetical protein
MLAREMPRTAAAFLELDWAHRTKSPVEPGLRAAMRYVAAQANGCTYAQASAEADARRAGVPSEKWASLCTPERSAWSTAEQSALKFAYDMSVDSDGVTDEQFAQLVQHFSDRQAQTAIVADRGRTPGRFARRFDRRGGCSRPRVLEPARSAQAIHYTAMRSLFDRMTEAAGL